MVYTNLPFSNPSNASASNEWRTSRIRSRLHVHVRATIDLSFAALFHDHFSHGDHAARIFDGDRSFAHSLSKE